MFNREHEITVEHLKEKFEIFTEIHHDHPTDDLYVLIAIYEVGLAIVERLEHPHK